MSSKKNKLVSGVIWDSIGQFSALGIQFLVLIIISRVLSPSDYGVIGLLSVFIVIAAILLDSGFSQALIQRKYVDQKMLSSIFYMNFAIGVVLYFILYFASPVIANYYNMVELTKYSRVLFLIIPINSLGLTQNVQIQKNMQFRKFAITNVGSAVISGGVGIWMAYSNFGIWSLVGQQLTLSVSKTTLFFIQMRWLPSLSFSFKSVRELFGFSMNLMLHSLINTTMNNIYVLVIGKHFSPREVGYYNQANKFEQISSSTITTILMRVSFPILVTMKDNVDQFRYAYIKILKMLSFVIVPLMSLLFCIAEPLFLTLLTEKWVPAVPYFRLLCIYGMSLPLVQLSYNIYKVFGKGKMLVRIDTLRHLIFITTICFTIKYGVIIMLTGQAIIMALMAILNLWYSGRLFNYVLLLALKDIAPYYIISFGTLCLVCFIPSLNEGILTVIFKSVVFILIYLMMTTLFKLSAQNEVIKIVKSKFQKIKC